MKHVDDETLAMLAVSDQVASDGVAEHLASCDRCRDEVAALQRVAAVTRASEGVGLIAPPEHVWEWIAAEIARTPQQAARATEPGPGAGRAPGAHERRARVPGAAPCGASPSASSPSARGRARWRRRARRGPRRRCGDRCRARTPPR